MSNFKKGDILKGKSRAFLEAYHPVVYIAGSKEAPLAVILTHSANFPCNIKLLGEYDNKPSYFVEHLIQKLPEWGPYKKTGELTKEDLKLVEETINGLEPITWDQYLKYMEVGCPQHG